MSDTESSADEDVPTARAGWIGTGEPVVIGSGYTRREVCDGMSLASPRRWPPDQRNYLQSVEWLEVAEKVREFARREGPPELLMKLALGQVNACPFPEQAIRSLKDELIASLAARGKVLKKLPTRQICRSTSDSWSCCWMLQELLRSGSGASRRV